MENDNVNMVEKLRQHLASLTQEEFDKEWEEITKMGFGGVSIIEEVYSPYCSECGGCGEEGCCSPLMCKQSLKGDYCQTYLRDLKFGYRMYQELMHLVGEDQKYKQQIDELWDKNYSIHYK